MQLTYLSHACFLIEGGRSRMIIDPFLKDNPSAPVGPEEIHVDYVLVTHGHPDHLGDAVPIANRCGATLVAPFELGVFCEGRGARNVHTMHIGGSHAFPFGSVKMTPAFHGSGFPGEHGMIYTGNPCGYLIRAEDKTIYHAGDTGLMMEMQLLGELNRIDVALLPIGDNFTMGEEDALHAARLLKARTVVPMHFGTFPVLTPDAKAFVEKAKAEGIGVHRLGIGETLEV